MKSIKDLIARNPVLCYFVLTFAISWGGVLILRAPYGMPIPAAQFAKLWPIVFIPFFLGPSLAGIFMTVLVNGGAGLRELFSRFFKWCVNFVWYAIALFTAPILTTLILSLLSLTSPVFLPAIFTATNKVGVILAGIVVGLISGGILEELGWTGFAVPNLRLRYNILNTGLIVGFLWGLWHILPTFWGSGDPAGVLSLSLFLPPCLFYIGVLPVYRVLMVLVYDRTGSLLVNMLMHMSLTASTLFIFLPPASGVSLAIYYIILTAALWGVIAVVSTRYKRL